MIFSHAANALLNSVWQSALLVALVWLGLRLHSRSSAALRAAIWSAVLLGVALLPFADYFVSRASSGVAINLARRTLATAVAGITIKPIPNAETITSAEPVTNADLGVQDQSTASGAETTNTQTAQLGKRARLAGVVRTLANKGVHLYQRGRQAITDAHTGTIRILSAFATAFVSIWILVAATLTARLGFRVLRLYRLKRSLLPVDTHAFSARVSGSQGLPAGRIRQFSIGTSADVPTPCVLGFLHPAIALPAFVMNDLSQSDRERIVLHEQAHVQRFDDWSKLAQQIIEGAFWFNPLVYMVGRLLDVEREIACDDHAASLDGNAVTYAQCLTNLASRRVRFARYYPVAGFVVGRKQLIVRIERLLGDRRGTSTQVGRLARVLVASLVVCSVSAAWIQTPLVAAGVAPLWQRATGTAARPTVNISSQQTETLQGTQDGSGATYNPPPSQNLLSTQASHVSHLVSTSTPTSSTTTSTPAHRGRGLTPAPTPTTSPKATSSLKKDAQKPLPSKKSRPHEVAVKTAPVSNKRRSQQVSEDNFIEQLNQLGYGSLQISDILKLRQHRISTSFVQAVVTAAEPQPDVQALIDLYDAGVTPSAVSHLRALGYRSLTLRDLIEAHNNSIAPWYLEGVAKTGYTGLSMSDVQSIHYHAVPLPYLAVVHSAGMTAISATQAAEMYQYQVPSDFVVGVAQAGYRNISEADVMSLRGQGVVPEYIIALKLAGYGHLSVAQLETFKQYNIEPAYAGALARMQYKNLSAEELTGLRERGVTPDYIAKLRKANPHHRAAFTVSELLTMEYSSTP